MLGFILKSIARERTHAWLLTLGLFIASAGVALLTSASATTVVVANQDLSNYWRTTYDILIRPTGSRTEIEEKYGLIEANHLSGIEGGITFEQYEEIKSIPGVEIAAPIAVMGYIPQFVTTETVGLMDQPGVYLVEQQERFNDGARIHSGENFTKHSYYYNGGDTPSNTSLPNSPITSFSPRANGFFEFPLLLAAIDPDQEARLAHLNEAMISGDYLTGSEPLDPRPFDINLGGPGDFPETLVTLPVLINSSTYIDRQISVELKRILLPPKVQTYQDIMERGGVEFLRTLPTETIGSLTVDSRQAYGTLIAGITEKVGIVGASLWDLPSRIHYSEVAVSIPFEGLVVEIIMPGGNSYGVFPSYREFRDPSSSDSVLEAAFQTEVRGMFNIELIPKPLDINRVPLETYFPPTATLLFDEAGNATPPVQLKPTINPAGYITSPPLMLTTLAAAQALLGDDAISAIRVRVEGIEELTPSAQRKIETIATEIFERTGLDVDITVGSSPTRVLVRVPEVGYVEERWIQKNVSLTYSHRMQTGHVLLLGAVGIIAMLFTLEFTWADTIRQNRILALYKALGWRSKSLFVFVLSRNLIFSVIGIFAGLLAALLLTNLLGLEPLPSESLYLLFLASIVICAIGGLCPAWQASQASPAEGLLDYGIQSHERVSDRQVSSLLSLAIQSITRRRVRTAISGSITALSALLLVIMLAITYEREGEFSGTFLGEFVLVHLESVHLAIIIIGLTLVVLSTFANLLSSVIERRREIGILKSLGWRNREVSNVFLLEGGWLGLISSILGSLAGTVLFVFYYKVFSVVSIWILFAGILIPTFVCLSAAIIPSQMASRISPAETIRTGNSN